VNILYLESASDLWCESIAYDLAEQLMRRALTVAAICLVGICSFAQSDTWTVGTIVDVKLRPGMKSVDVSSSEYDISIKVGDTIYIVLYTTPKSRTGLPYRAGHEVPIRVGSTMLTFLDVRGGMKEVPILSSRKVSAWRGDKKQ
jgi:hypothetical protein